MAQSEVKKIIRQLKKNEIRVFDVPEEYENDIQIVTFERKAGLRITGKRGFDIISNSFFVKEDLIHIDVDGEERKRSVFLSFDKFDSYFDYSSYRGKWVPDSGRDYSFMFNMHPGGEESESDSGDESDSSW